MANIILVEKRFPNIGEVCAIRLSDLKTTEFTMEKSDKENFDYGKPKLAVDAIKNEEEYNFLVCTKKTNTYEDYILLKYIGYGMFLDIVNDCVINAVSYVHDGFGTDEYNRLDYYSRKEIENISKIDEKLISGKNIMDITNSYNVFIKNPLVIRIDDLPFLSINSEIASAFATQDIAKLKEKVTNITKQGQIDVMNSYKKVLSVQERNAYLENQIYDENIKKM